MTAIVYLATNRVNGKRYVGVTSKKLAERRYFHEWGALKGRATCRVFHQAIRKYGPAAFGWIELLSCESFEIGLREEIRLIGEIKPEYNLTLGGQGTLGLKAPPGSIEKGAAKRRGRKPSPETIAKIVAKTTGQKRTTQQRARMSASRKGIKFSDEHLRNMSAARLGRKLSDEHKAKIVAANSAWLTARNKSPENRAKVSAATMGHPGYGKGKKKDPEAVRRRWETRRRNQEARCDASN